MVYTCNMKSSGGKNRNHRRSVVVLEHFRNIKDLSLPVDSGVQNRKRGNTYPGEKKLWFEIQKRKVKH